MVYPPAARLHFVVQDFTSPSCVFSLSSGQVVTDTNNTVVTADVCVSVSPALITEETLPHR